jgi:GPI mannosyltransferase 3
MVNLRSLPTLLLIFLLFCFAAFINSGWIHPDEHFQILEFANSKRGLTDAKNLPWEFAARARSAIQPSIALLLIELAGFIGVNDPFTQSLLLRLISVVLFIACSFRLFLVFKDEFRNDFFRNLLFAATFLLYIFPLSGARFTSENWSTCFFMLGFATLYPFIRRPFPGVPPIQSMIIAGFFFGVSFLFRYQSGIMIASLALWLIFLRLGQIKSWFIMAGGFLIALAFGIVVDYWFYGEWVIAAYNYFYVNIVKGVAASFGVDPWWWYLDYLRGSRGLMLLNAFYLVLLCVFPLIRFRHVVTWIFFPFLLIHFAIGHKEMRFLYPIFIFLPYMFVTALQFIDSKLRNNWVIPVSVMPIVILNILGFVTLSLRGVENSTDIFQFFKTLPDKPIVVYFKGDNFYYTLYEKTQAPLFYKGNHDITAKKYSELTDLLHKKPVSADTLTFIVLDKTQQEQLNGALQPAFNPRPAFIEKVNYRNWMRIGFPDWKVYSLNESVR